MRISKRLIVKSDAFVDLTDATTMKFIGSLCPEQIQDHGEMSEGDWQDIKDMAST